MSLIKSIKIISTKEHKDVLMEDLDIVFESVNFAESDYKLSDFESAEASADDKKIIEKYNSMVALTVWDKLKDIKNIYFTDEYFSLDEDERVSYFFHEICHFIVYSKNNESEKILAERQKIDKNCRDSNFSSGEILAKHTHCYLLTLFNEQLTDKLMIKLKPELFIKKLKSSIKSHYESIESTTNLYDLYNQLIDVMRSTELIKDNENFSEELKKLQQAKETTTKKLKEECDDGNRFNVYMEFKEKLLVSYKSENALSTIETFNQLISKLIFC
ncbi:hypothetical protein J4458_06275 [Candidatus Woesearchaeota archaeon]|nr:hypothetical protein [Candidatus Woesearchaeota archaeon]